MSNLHQQWIELIKQTRTWIEQKWEEGCRFTYAKPKTIKLPPSPTPPKVLPKADPPIPKLDMPKEKWALNPMPLPDSSDSLYHSFKGCFKGETLTEPHVPIVLLLPEDRADHRLFFENVARALTSTKAPAKVRVAKTLPLKELSIQLILAPYSLMQKEYPGLTTHHFYPTKGLTLLPLEEIESYLKDINLKRTLWNTLKTWHFPNTPQSSST